MQKVTQNKEFIPSNKSEAKNVLKANNFGLYSDEYDLKKEHDFFEHQAQKEKMLYGDFKKAYKHDNGMEVDEFGHKKKKLPTLKRNS